MSAALKTALCSAMDELRLVTPIVQACLASMTSKQKADVHAKLAAADISPDGMTRANEREAVITAGAAALIDTAKDANVGQFLVVELPYSTASIKAINFEDQADMRVRQAACILRLLPDDSYSTPMLYLARRVADDLVAAAGPKAAVMLASQLAELLRLLQGDEFGPCDLLWAAQQAADEARAIFDAVHEVGQVGVAA